MGVKFFRILSSPSYAHSLAETLPQTQNLCIIQIPNDSSNVTTLVSPAITTVKNGVTQMGCNVTIPAPTNKRSRTGKALATVYKAVVSKSNINVVSKQRVTSFSAASYVNSIGFKVVAGIWAFYFLMVTYFFVWKKTKLTAHPSVLRKIQERTSALSRLKPTTHTGLRKSLIFARALYMIQNYWVELLQSSVLATSPRVSQLTNSLLGVLSNLAFNALYYVPSIKVSVTESLIQAIICTLLSTSVSNIFVSLIKVAPSLSFIGSAPAYLFSFASAGSFSAFLVIVSVSWSTQSTLLWLFNWGVSETVNIFLLLPFLTIFQALLVSSIFKQIVRSKVLTFVICFLCKLEDERWEDTLIFFGIIHTSSAHSKDNASDSQLKDDQFSGALQILPTPPRSGNSFASLPTGEGFEHLQQTRSRPSLNKSKSRSRDYVSQESSKSSPRSSEHHSTGEKEQRKSTSRASKVKSTGFGEIALDTSQSNRTSRRSSGLTKQPSSLHGVPSLSAREKSRSSGKNPNLPSGPDAFLASASKGDGRSKSPRKMLPPSIHVDALAAAPLSSPSRSLKRVTSSRQSQDQHKLEKYSEKASRNIPKQTSRKPNQ
eukprot:GILI01015722.1.p1 GENE.GILI01015722.1~~GILI01015722.1.p1  ORF type:complete len:664 (+),score=51.08 GILI01015722.1:196-1992(+)